MGRHWLWAGMIGIAACGGGGGLSLMADLEPFVLQPAEEEALRQAEETGAVAEGRYEYDPSTGALHITVDRSSFECEGPREGEPLDVEVTLDGDVMTWDFDDSPLVWNRLDEGSGITGVWEAEDAEQLFIVIADDGSVNFAGAAVECAEDRERNGESCERLQPSEEPIVIDGAFDDWSSVGVASTIEDKSGDSTFSDDSGTDLSALKVALSSQDLFLLTATHGPPSTEVLQGRQSPMGGTLRVTIRDEGAGSFVARLSYNPEAEQWALIEPQNDPGVAFRVGDEGVEWSISLDHFPEAPNLSLILFEVLDCGIQGSPCQSIDDGDACAFIKG